MNQDDDKCSRCGQILIGSINNRICVRCGSPEFPRGTEERVCEDIASRQRLGFGNVEANHLPLVEWLRHAYHETLDKAIYLRRAIEEMEKHNPAPEKNDREPERKENDGHKRALDYYQGRGGIETEIE